MSKTKETWENVTKSPVFVTGLNSRDQLIDVAFPPGRRVTITEEERLINEDKAATPELNPFRNGMLNPVSEVKLLDGREEGMDVAAAPNHLSNKELKELFSSHWKTFEKRVSEIDSAVTIRRLLNLANEDADGNVTKKQIDILKDRLAEVDKGAIPVIDRENGLIDVEPAITPERPVTR